MNFLIQDDIIRRALDFFGLRGVVSHEYDPTIRPVAVVANLEQPAFVQLIGGTGLSGVDLMIVPPNETWKPILFAGTITQTAGATAPRYILNALQAGAYNFNLRASFSTPTLAASEVLAFTAELNVATKFFCNFGNDILLPGGTSLQYVQTGGNGVIVANSQSFLMFRRLGERLVDLRP